MKQSEAKYQDEQNKFGKSLWFDVNQNIKGSHQFLKSEQLQQKYLMNSQQFDSEQEVNQIKPKADKNKKQEKKSSKKNYVLLTNKPKAKKSIKEQRLFQFKPTEGKSNQLTKRKLSKKGNSTSNQRKKSSQELKTSKQILKNELNHKEQELFAFKINLDKLDIIADTIREYSTSTSKYPLQTLINFIKSTFQNQIKSIFPVVAKLMQSILFLLEEPLKNSTMVSHTLGSVSSNENTNRIIYQDIEKLEQMLIRLKQENARLRESQTSSMIQRLRQQAAEQQQELQRLKQMEIQLESYEMNQREKYIEEDSDVEQ